MQQILNFITTNYKLIISGVLLVISVVVFILRKRPVNDILSYIFQACLKAVNDVENFGIKGSDQKLACAVEIVVKVIQTYFPEIDIKTYSGLIITTIESILSTPQKKK